MTQKPKAKDIFEKVEKDVTSLRWDRERANAIVEAIKAYEEEGNTTKANERRWEGLLFNLRYLHNLDERKKQRPDLLRWLHIQMEPCFQMYEILLNNKLNITK
jgi:hypothetical protein